MKKTIITLVRCGQNYTYVSRSFDHIDEEAINIIKGCIEEDFDDVFTKEEIQECFTRDLDKIIEDYKPIENEPFPSDFEHQGDIIWEYNDGIETIQYKLHESIIELKDTDTSYEAYIKSRMNDFKPGINPKEKSFRKGLPVRTQPRILRQQGFRHRTLPRTPDHPADVLPTCQTMFPDKGRGTGLQ